MDLHIPSFSVDFLKNKEFLNLLSLTQRSAKEKDPSFALAKVNFSLLLLSFLVFCIKEPSFTDRHLPKRKNASYGLTLTSKKVDSQEAMSNIISLTHKSLEANFSDKKTNLLQEIIKINDSKKDYNLSYLRNYFFSPTNLPQLPQFKKKLQISYLQTNKDLSKIKDNIIKKVSNKKNVLSQLITESMKSQNFDENYLLHPPKDTEG